MIANHIEALMAAEIMATVKREKTVKIDFATELENEAIYLVDDYHFRALEIERKIKEKYPRYRLECYRTSRKAAGLEYVIRQCPSGEGAEIGGCASGAPTDRGAAEARPLERLGRDDPQGL